MFARNQCYESPSTLEQNNMKLWNMRFEKIEIWEGVASCKKVIILGEGALVNNFLEYLYTAKILFYFILTNLRWKRKNI